VTPGNYVYGRVVKGDLGRVADTHAARLGIGTSRLVRWWLFPEDVVTSVFLMEKTVPTEEELARWMIRELSK
jgi:hypothetical protein